MSKEIKIIINKEDGSISCDTEGFKGSTCLEDVKSILKNTSADLSCVEKTPDYYKKQEVTLGVNVRN